MGKHVFIFYDAVDSLVSGLWSLVSGLPDSGLWSILWFVFVCILHLVQFTWLLFFLKVLASLFPSPWSSGTDTTCRGQPFGHLASVTLS